MVLLRAFFEKLAQNRPSNIFTGALRWRKIKFGPRGDPRPPCALRLFVWCPYPFYPPGLKGWSGPPPVQNQLHQINQNKCSLHAQGKEAKPGQRRPLGSWGDVVGRDAPPVLKSPNLASLVRLPAPKRICGTRFCYCGVNNSEAKTPQSPPNRDSKGKGEARWVPAERCIQGSKNSDGLM